MKRRTAFFSLLILLGLVLASAYPAAAHRPDYVPTGASSATSSDGLHSPQISLGKPGLSFRYTGTFGVTDEPYLADVTHFNSPDGVFVDGSNNLYVVEQNGQRVLGYNPAGVNIFKVGHAGLARYMDDFLYNPTDVVKDSTGNLWVAMEHAIKVFNSSGSPLLTFPQANPGQSGNDNFHFNIPNGIAFDQNGRLFVSDEKNHRVQIYTVSGTTLTYVNTIGVTSESGGDNTHFFNPARITFDSSNALYVVDTTNFRVQKCTSTDNWANWTCSTFFTGLAFPFGIAIDNTNQVYIADGDNNRVLKCTPGGTCDNFVGELGVSGSDNSHFGWVPALTTDSYGNLYVCDQSNSRIQVYDKNGLYVKTIGNTQVPYVADTQRYYEPWSVAAAGNGGVYIGENHGDRLIKANPNGTQAWTVGHAGIISRTATGYFGSFGASATPAETLDGKVYLPDAGNNRIQIYDAVAGTFIGSFGQRGQGSNQFNGPFSVAINPVNQDILVADLFNHRVQVFDRTWAYKTTIGVTGIVGSDNGYFNNPVSVTVNSSGVVFVADRNNFRVQQCTTSDGILYTCTVFAGVTGENGNDYAHLQPSGIALDKDGRLYVADDSHNRIQVFDANGGYLTTIGGIPGPYSGELRQPEGVAVNQDGSVYITDTYNQRIQKFIPGVPGWQQDNINGFGEQTNNGVSALAVFNGQLYASSANFSGIGARIWQTSSGTDWTPASALGLGDGAAVPEVLAMVEFNGKLYAATGWSTVRIYRSDNGTNWENVVSDGFSNTQNQAITFLTAYGGMLYAAVYNDTKGFELWRSATGNATDWSQVIAGGFSDSNNVWASSAVVFNGLLYLGVTNAVTGDEVWQTNNGSNWLPVKMGGFGNANNNDVANLQVFQNQIYISMRNNILGVQVWRSSNGSDWENVVANGFGSANNLSGSFFVFGNYLYAATQNMLTGMQVWRSLDGKNWQQTGADGMGDSNNNIWSNDAIAIFNKRPFIATWNDANGGEVWQLISYPVYMPVIKR